MSIPRTADSHEELRRAAETLAALTGGLAPSIGSGFPARLHGATVLSIDLGGCSAARLRTHTFRHAGATDPAGFLEADRHAVVKNTLPGVLRRAPDDLHMIPPIIVDLDVADSGIPAVRESSYGARLDHRARGADRHQPGQALKACAFDDAPVVSRLS